MLVALQWNLFCAGCSFVLQGGFSAKQYKSTLNDA
jgi:hypothetical protein